jgi:hypothetical protein
VNKWLEKDDSSNHTGWFKAAIKIDNREGIQILVYSLSDKETYILYESLLSSALYDNGHIYIIPSEEDLEILELLV